MPKEEDLLSFEEFLRRVGASDQATRAALFALNLRPIRKPSDRRRTYYRNEWVEQVRTSIERRD